MLLTDARRQPSPGRWPTDRNRSDIASLESFPNQEARLPARMTRSDGDHRPDRVFPGLNINPEVSNNPFCFSFSWCVLLCVVP